MFSRDQFKRAASLTEEDFVQLGECRRPHNRLGFAYQVAFVRLFDRFPLGSAQIDVKISFKGRTPNKESPQSPLCRYVSPAKGLHTKRNVILDAWRTLKRLNFALPMRKKEIKDAFLRSRKQALAAD